MPETGVFPCGVIEGFYGRPWTTAQRERLLGWMKEWGLNTYLYAPKDDLKHRALWREHYDADELAALGRLAAGCHERGINFVYAIAPGLDVTYHAELPVLTSKLRQVAALGVSSLAMLFDDIPETMKPEDRERFGSFAAAQARVANGVRAALRAEDRAASLWFCPTVYCGRFADARVAGNAYLRELGDSLHADIEVMWTGPEVVSETITPESIREVAAVLRRKPIIWDNLHANDYDLRRIYLGPYCGRPAELRAEVRGLLSNPNCEFEANFIPLHTLAAYARADGAWDAGAALQAACAMWWPRFVSTAGAAVTLDDVRLLVDFLYLPFAHGRRAAGLIEDYARLLQQPAAAWAGAHERFEQTCADIAALQVKLTELADRELGFTFLRHWVELVLETIVMRGAVARRTAPGAAPFNYQPGGDLRPKKYRGGVVADLQRLLPMDRRGAFSIARDETDSSPAD